MSSTAASGFVFLLLCVQVIQSLETWGVIYTPTEVCAVKGSTVYISCRYTYPSRIQHDDIRKTIWFTKEKNGQPVDLRSDSDYLNRVGYRCTDKKCSLSIENLRESDSAEYKFMFTTDQPQDAYTGAPGVTLSVTGPGLEVKVSRLDSTWVDLQCLSSTVLPTTPSYIWYKNGENIKTGSSSLSVYFGSSNSYSCAVKGPGNPCSPSVYAPKLASVSVRPTDEIMEGSSVTLTCSSDANPAAIYTWYKANQPRVGEGPQLVFSSIQSPDSGEYYCGADNQMGTKRSAFISIDVKYAPKLPSVSVNPSEIVEGSSVTLTCSSDANPAASYTWYKEKQTYPFGEGDIRRFTSISSEDSGIYYCKSKNQHGEIMSPALSVDVQYPPRLTSVSVSPPDEIVEGSSVTLTCSCDANPAAKYTWYKGIKKLLREPEGVFHFTSISFKNRGTYYCKAENKHGSFDSSSLVLDVLYTPKRPSVSVSPSAEIMEGSSVNLTCSSDANPPASYTWYKVDEDLPKASGRIFIITNFTDEHSGKYSCEAKNTIGRSNSTFHLSVAAPAAVVDIKTMVLQSIYWILAVLVLSSMILFFLWLRKKKAVISTTEPPEPIDEVELDVYHAYENISDNAAQPEDTEEFKDYTLQIYDKLLKIASD